MSLSKNIRGVVAILEKAILQTPKDKQPFLSMKIGRLMRKYS